MHEEKQTKTFFGFWVYLMTDCVLFAILFATYAVLHKGTFGGPSGKDLFNLPYALTQTLILLVSSFTSGLVVLYNSRKRALLWLFVTILLGASFLAMELTEFTHLVKEGNSWTRSAFLSSYFTLVGTHGAHITVGLLWSLVLVGQLLSRGLNSHVLRRLFCFSLFWHFLDLIWIFIFTFVYLLGVA